MANEKSKQHQIVKAGMKNAGGASPANEGTGNVWSNASGVLANDGTGSNVWNSAAGLANSGSQIIGFKNAGGNTGAVPANQGTTVSTWGAGGKRGAARKPKNKKMKSAAGDTTTSTVDPMSFGIGLVVGIVATVIYYRMKKKS